MITLYKSLVRPHLEYAVQFWSPYQRRDIDKIERVQRTTTKMIPEIRNHSYQQRLKDLKLISLVRRRPRGQLIEVFKYLNRFTNVSPIGLFDYDFNDRTRNNGNKLIVKRFNTSVAQYFFPINITTTWNALPYDVVNSRTVNTFKNHLDAHWEDNHQMYRSTGNTDDVPSLILTVVSPAWMRANRHTIRYITTHNIANPLRHTVTGDLANGMTQLSISLLNWVNYHKHTNTKEKLKV